MERRPPPRGYQPKPYRGTDLQVITNLSPARAIELGIPAERLRWVSEWHASFKSNRHQHIAGRLNQIANAMASVNDNRPRRTVA